MPEHKKSAMQHLKEISDVFEIWWDSSPLVFEPWAKEMIEKADPAHKDKLAAQLKVLFDTDNPSGCLFDGVTTNPKLTNTAIGILKDEMIPVVDEIIEGNRAKDNYLLAWKTIHKNLLLDPPYINNIFSEVFA
jgi:transaldolase